MRIRLPYAVLLASVLSGCGTTDLDTSDTDTDIDMPTTTDNVERVAVDKALDPAARAADPTPAVISVADGVTSVEDIVVSYKGLTPDPTNWFTIVPEGADEGTVREWQYTHGRPNGSLLFAPVPAGNWEIRAYLNDGFTRAATATIQVAVGAYKPAIKTKARYATAEAIVVEYTGLTRNPSNWITIVPAGSDLGSYAQWTHTNGIDGTTQFDALPEGQYEVRAFYNDGWTLAATSSLTVKDIPAVATDMTMYAAGDTVMVTFQEMPGNAHDWMSIAPVGFADDYTTTWSYLNGEKSGRRVFEGLPAGDYEARIFADDSTNVLARSQFTIAP
jgi:Ca-activated chloride channel homolog